MGEHFDAIVVGSGFGGSVVAYRLAKEGKRVCVLERGKRYPPGSFPRTPAAFARNFWDPDRGCHGMFDIWSFKGLEAVVGSGVGGGSLIYANVMLRKDEKWFYDTDPDGTTRPWPVSRQDLDPHYDNVEEILQPTPFPFDVAPYSAVAKTKALQDTAAKVADGRFMLPPLAVTFAAPGQGPTPGAPFGGPNLHGAMRSTCCLCGECDVGCNSGAKNTLDYNYLSLAVDHGAEIRDRCEVKDLNPRTSGGGYTVTYVDYSRAPEGAKTNKLPRLTVTADRLVLGAGTFGSTFLLLKNRKALGLENSKTLGTRFCGNGDLLGFVIGGERTLDPDAGPVITAAIRVDDKAECGTGPGYYVEDGGTPTFANWVTVGVPTLGAARRIARFAYGRVKARLLNDPHSDLGGEISALFGQPATILPLLGMGRDVPDGTMTLRRGNLANDWTTATSLTHFGRVEDTMRAIATQVGGKFRSNPTWKRWRRVVTVHPLGGCPMGTDAHTGVVDAATGEVFGAPRLHVVDGAVMPGPVGPNPSLTIAALADRFATGMLR